MARRKTAKRLYIYSPVELAVLVHGNFIKKAAEKAGDWAENYKGRLFEYATSNAPDIAVKKVEAMAKLSAWYTILKDEVVPKVKEIYGSVKGKHYALAERMKADIIARLEKVAPGLARAVKEVLGKTVTAEVTAVAE